MNATETARRTIADTPRDKPERTPDTTSEAIAQGSPSGRISKRARAAAQERLRVELFGKRGPCQPTDAQRRAWLARDERERATRQAGSPKRHRPEPGFYARLIEQHRPK